MAHTNSTVLDKIRELYEMLFRHDGFGEMRIEMRFLKRHQKEVIIHCGKQYRYVVDFKPTVPVGGRGAPSVDCADVGSDSSPGPETRAEDSASESPPLDERKEVRSTRRPQHVGPTSRT